MSPYKLFYGKYNQCYLFHLFIHCYIIFIVTVTDDFSCRRHNTNTANHMLGSKLIE